MKSLIDHDAINKLAAKSFEGYIVRQDLVRKFKDHYPAPTTAI